MKLIHKFKSPNFNERKYNKISLIIIHYTAIRNNSESIKHLCSNKTRVSCHYLISKTGSIFSLVSEKKRAWHAGEANWNGIKDINSKSIGIELDYTPDYDMYFSKRQINSLIKLIKKIKVKHKINSRNILGHSDVSPYRKIDPGEKFPWQKLYNLNLAYNPKKIKTLDLKKMKNWFKKNKIYKNKKKILIMLNIIGYDISKSINNKYYFAVLLKNYRNRFLQKINFKNSDLKLIDFIELHTCNLLLTKV